jgi:hypothetical protein
VLLFEMTFGYTPFSGSSMQETFSNIVTKELKFPPKHSASREVNFSYITSILLLDFLSGD